MRTPSLTTRWLLPFTFSLVLICPGGMVRPRPATVSAEPAGPAVFAPQFKPTLRATRISESIQVDGELDDPGWRRASRAVGFAEVSPGDQIEPPVASEAWVAYDNSYFYVALIAYDDPADVRASICERDNIFRDDYFGIMLDTYGDQSWGYEIFVNPLGIQGDLRMHSSGWEDITFDLIWESRGKVTDSGYQVEIGIPFASLRFPDSNIQTWRINFWRDHQRDVRRRYAWAATDRDNPCFLCQWGTLEGIENVQSGRHLEVIASALGSQAGEMADTDDPYSPFDDGRMDGEGGVNLRYGLSTSSSAELAVNPDFSQVESDAGQIDVNSTFALFFPERRPFFQEGSDLYDTWISAVYTRSINNPDVAGKISGRLGQTSALYLLAHDNHSPMIIPMEERSGYLELNASLSNIVRVKRSLGDDSFMGLLATDRRLQGGGSGSVLGADAQARLWNNYRLELQFAASRTMEPTDTTLTEDLTEDLTADSCPITFGKQGHTVAFDGETFGGHGLYASLERGGRIWDFDIDYWEYDPAFRTDNGFTTRNDYREVSGWTGLYFQPNRRSVVDWGMDVGVGRVWSYDKRFKDEWLRPSIWFDTMGQTNVGGQYLISKERFGPEVFPGIRIWSVWFNTRFSEVLGGGFSARCGKGIYRDFENPELAKQRGWSAYADLRPSQRVVLNCNLDYARMDSRETGEVLYAGYILRNRLTVNFTREWYFRMVLQYNDFNERLDVEPLLTYRINPFTVFYIGSVGKFLRYDEEEYPALDQSDWRSSSRQYFAKLQYLFRL